MCYYNDLVVSRAFILHFISCVCVCVYMIPYPSKIPFKTVYVQLRLLSVYICTDGEQILEEEEEKQT